MLEFCRFRVHTARNSYGRCSKITAKSLFHCLLFNHHWLKTKARRKPRRGLPQKLAFVGKGATVDKGDDLLRKSSNKASCDVLFEN